MGTLVKLDETSWQMQYTDEEVVAAWSHPDSVRSRHGLWTVEVECEQTMAIAIAQIFLKTFFLDPSCQHYDGKMLRIYYCGAAG